MSLTHLMRQLCAVISLGSQADTDAAVAAAKAALPSWSISTKADRVALLERLYDIYERRMDDMAEAISMEMGAPIDFSKASQATSGTSAIKEFTRQLKKFEFEEQLLRIQTINCYMNQKESAHLLHRGTGQSVRSHLRLFLQLLLAVQWS